MAEQNAPEYPPALELEKELTRKERQIEYLQTELRRYHNLMEELKQGMRPIGTVEENRSFETPECWKRQDQFSYSDRQVQARPTWLRQWRERSANTGNTPVS